MLRTEVNVTEEVPSKGVIERIKAKALELLEQHPEGLRYSELRSKILAGDGNLSTHTINSNIWKVKGFILEGWESCKNKVANRLLVPENEKMMQLQLAQIYQMLAPIYEYEVSESIKVLLEVPATIRGTVFRSIDIVIAHTLAGGTLCYPIELKCFRLRTRSGAGRRGAQNLGMYDYWEDIENIEGYSGLAEYAQAFQFTLTDDPYYVNTQHKGPQVAVYSTNKSRMGVGPVLSCKSIRYAVSEGHI